MRADLGRASDDPDETCADLKSAPVRWGVLILGSEQTLAAAERKAREISDKAGVRFSTEGYSIDPKTGRAVFERGHDGEYYARTSLWGASPEAITIELSSAYASFRPNLFIVVGAVVTAQMPESFAKYRDFVPSAYVKYSALTGDPGGYGATSACLDSDLIVLGRTRSFREAELIARELSKLSGVPYAARALKPGATDYYSARHAPYPNISVESDNAYGEREESPYFLVVGAELNGSEGAALNTPEGAAQKLFERYKAVAPNAYRMKRARHVCGA